jgi:DNA replication licensing factor MCM2
MDETTRRIAELRMQRRDVAEGKGAFGQGSRAPAFIQMDDDQDALDAEDFRRRRRRHYDELVQPDVDEDEDEEAPIDLDQLREAKTDSLDTWIALEPVRRAIAKEFKNFLVTTVDDKLNSIYGTRAFEVGESEWCSHKVMLGRCTNPLDLLSLSPFRESENI